MALSSRAHAFSVEALIGTNKKRKLRDWEDKGLDLSMESLSPNGQLGDGEDPTQCLDLNPGQCRSALRQPLRETPGAGAGGSGREMKGRGGGGGVVRRFLGFVLFFFLVFSVCNDFSAALSHFPSRS